MNKARKGGYYRLKTKKWLEADGYQVENLEKNQRIYTEDKKTGQKKVIFIKRDLWGADLIAKNDQELIFVQCKTNVKDISKGIKELNASTWPKWVHLWVAIWKPRAREPEIIDARR